MITATIGKFLLQHASSQILDLVRSGKLQAFGSTLVDPRSHRVVGYLQATDTIGAYADTAKVLTALIGLANPLTAAPALAYVVGKPAFAVFDTQRTAHRIEDAVSQIATDIEQVDRKLDDAGKGIEGLRNQSNMGLGLQLLDIGINVAGFATMDARLEEISGRVLAIDDGFKEFQETQLKLAFTELRTLARLMDEGWRLSAKGGELRWREVASRALHLQDQFETRARDLLGRSWAQYPIADPMLDAASFANGLRVTALSALNETAAAIEAAADGTKMIESLTGRLGAVDLIGPRLRALEVAPGTQEWANALAELSNEANATVSRVRNREANIATRAAPLLSLEERGILPRDWLEGVRSQSGTALLYLPANNEDLPA